VPRRLSRSKQNQWTREAPDLIPVWVEMLHACRLDNDPNRPVLERHGKVERNDLCPCGSGKKYKGAVSPIATRLRLMQLAPERHGLRP
jgi:uncharacterized protein